MTTTADELRLRYHDPGTIKVTISETNIELPVLFNIDCTNKMFDYYEQGDSYRSAFAKAVFYMYTQRVSSDLAEDDFINAPDVSLQFILEYVLTQDESVKYLYEQGNSEDIYERFFTANKQIIENGPVAKLLERMSKIHKWISEISIDFQKTRRFQTEILAKHDWFLTESLYGSVVAYMHKKQDTLETSDIDQIMVNYFKYNEYQHLKGVVQSWTEVDCFNQRSRIFDESFDNHTRGKFNSSVTLLTIHIEGIITDFFMTVLKEPREKVGQLLDRLKGKFPVEEEGDNIYVSVFTGVIKQIKEKFTMNFDPNNPIATSNESRHKIAHGQVYERENEVSSLKLFLQLNELYCMFLLLKNKIAEEEKGLIISR